jgi:hypothetical protein
MSCIGAVCWCLPFLKASWSSTDCFFRTDLLLKVKVKVKVTLRLTVSQSVSLGVEPHLGLMTGYLLQFDSYGLVFVGPPLWREYGSVCCIYCWTLSAQSFSGPSPVGLATYFIVSDLRLSSPPMTRRVTVEVFDTASTWLISAEIPVLR